MQAFRPEESVEVLFMETPLFKDYVTETNFMGLGDWRCGVGLRARGCEEVSVLEFSASEAATSKKLFASAFLAAPLVAARARVYAYEDIEVAGEVYENITSIGTVSGKTAVEVVTWMEAWNARFPFFQLLDVVRMDEDAPVFLQSHVASILGSDTDAGVEGLSRRIVQASTPSDFAFACIQHLLDADPGFQTTQQPTRSHIVVHAEAMEGGNGTADGQVFAEELASHLFTVAEATPLADTCKALEMLEGVMYVSLGGDAGVCKLRLVEPFISVYRGNHVFTAARMPSPSPPPSLPSLPSPRSAVGEAEGAQAQASPWGLLWFAAVASGVAALAVFSSRRHQ